MPLYAAAELVWALEDLERTESVCSESLELFRELGDKVGQARTLFEESRSSFKIASTTNKLTRSLLSYMDYLSERKEHLFEVTLRHGNQIAL